MRNGGENKGAHTHTFSIAGNSVTLLALCRQSIFKIYLQISAGAVRLHLKPNSALADFEKLPFVFSSSCSWLTLLWTWWTVTLFLISWLAAEQFFQNLLIFSGTDSVLFMLSVTRATNPHTTPKHDISTLENHPQTFCPSNISLVPQSSILTSSVQSTSSFHSTRWLIDCM